MSEDPTQSAIYELTLSFDVPQVDRKEEPYARMIQTALRTLARVMDGALISDDNGQPLSETAIGRLPATLLALYDTLDARELVGRLGASAPLVQLIPEPRSERTADPYLADRLRSPRAIVSLHHRPPSALCARNCSTTATSTTCWTRPPSRR